MQRTIVLVHGAWHGGWCYRRVADLLRAAGHRVHTLTMTGLGERSHLLSAVGQFIDPHRLADIVNMIRWEDIRQIILVGHSYGGMVVTGVADAMPERVSALVYLDDFVPTAGKSFHDILPVEVAEAQVQGARDCGRRQRGWWCRRFQPPGSTSMQTIGRGSIHCALPHPLGTLTQPIELTGSHTGIANISYVLATENKLGERFLHGFAACHEKWNPSCSS